MRPPGSPLELERRRFRAVALLQQGIQPHAIAERLGVDRRSVRRWKRAYGHQGRKSLVARPIPGRPARLTLPQRRRLVRDILKGPEACGFRTALWTCPRVVQLIQRRFRVRYHPDHIGRLLRACGLTPQRPQRVAKERHPQRIRHWLQHDWPRLKKNSPGSGPA